MSLNDVPDLSTSIDLIRPLYALEAHGLQPTRQEVERLFEQYLAVATMAYWVETGPNERSWRLDITDRGKELLELAGPRQVSDLVLEYPNRTGTYNESWQQQIEGHLVGRVVLHRAPLDTVYDEHSERLGAISSVQVTSTGVEVKAEWDEDVLQDRYGTESDLFPTSGG